MSKSHLSVTRRVVNSVWKAIKMLEDRPVSTSKVKLHGRRGYGDVDAPRPDQHPDKE